MVNKLEFYSHKLKCAVKGKETHMSKRSWEAQKRRNRKAAELRYVLSNGKKEKADCILAETKGVWWERQACPPNPEYVERNHSRGEFELLVRTAFPNLHTFNEYVDIFDKTAFEYLITHINYNNVAFVRYLFGDVPDKFSLMKEYDKEKCKIDLSKIGLDKNSALLMFNCCSRFTIKYVCKNKNIFGDNLKFDENDVKNLIKNSRFEIRICDWKLLIDSDIISPETISEKFIHDIRHDISKNHNFHYEENICSLESAMLGNSKIVDK